MFKRISDRAGARVNALKQQGKVLAVTGIVAAGMLAQQAQAALDTTAFDAETTAMKTDINYAGQAFLFVSVAVAVWLWIRRAAK